MKKVTQEIDSLSSFLIWGMFDYPEDCMGCVYGCGLYTVVILS